MNFTRDDLLDWLKRNRHTLADRTPDEVASLAHYVGFDMALVCEVLSHFGDAMRGSSIENRTRFQTRLECAEIARQGGQIDLTEQWHALYWKLTEDKDFDSERV